MTKLIFVCLFIFLFHAFLKEKLIIGSLEIKQEQFLTMVILVFLIKGKQLPKLVHLLFQVIKGIYYSILTEQLFEQKPQNNGKRRRFNRESEASQPSIIIPKPNSNSIYYVFTTRKTKTENPSLFPGIYFSEVEISNKYPLGKVTQKNIRLENSTAQRITAVHHKTEKIFGL